MGRRGRAGSHRRRELSALAARLLALTSQLGGAAGPGGAWARHAELARLVEAARALEGAEGAVSRRGRPGALAAFLAWLREHGAELDGIEVSEFDGYDLGLKALKNFKEGSDLLTIPRKLMMTEEDAKKSSLGSFIQSDPLLQNMPNITLALFLLLEKNNPDSFWKPYLDILPETYSTVLYFNTEELQEIKPSPVFDKALKLLRSITRQYAYFYNKFHTVDTPGTQALRDVFTYDSYRWAVSTVMTRQNSIADSAAFIPLWDMCNHEHGKITTGYNPELGRGECYALREFTPGEQVFIFYGARSNGDLFLHNGFVYLENKQDSLPVALGVSSSDPLKEQRVQLLSKLGLTGVTHFSLYGSGPAISAELLAFIRIFNMSKEDLSKWLSNGQFGDLVSSEPESAAAVGSSLDRKAYNYLQTRCSLIAAGYRRSQAADSLQNGELTVHRKNINLLKQCELKILERTIEQTKEAIERLPKDDVEST